MTTPSRASSDQPRRSALRTARTSTVTTAQTKPIAAATPELRGSEPLAARFVEVVGERRERTEPVRGDRAEQLDEPERIRLRHSPARRSGTPSRFVACCHRKSSVGRLASAEVARPTAPKSAAMPSRPGRRRASALTTAQMARSERRNAR